MNGINAFMIGRAGHDPEMQYLPDSAAAVVRLNVAVDDYYRNEAVIQWVRCQFFGANAEHVNPYITKGARIGVSGRIRVESYTRRDGTPGFGLNMTCGQRPRIIDWPDNSGGGASASSSSSSAALDGADDVDSLPY